MRCVVFGATGYLGGRLVPELLRAGHSVRVLARTPGKLADAPWRDQVDIVRGDVTVADDVRTALAGREVLYYLVHSLTRSDFDTVDRDAATIVAREADTAGLDRIVYLGGIAPAGQQLSRHLSSRAEVGRILLDGAVPALVLQAAVVIGSGSASFEMLRYLTERLPMMVTPRWVRSRIQPIAVRDVLYYLTRAADLPAAVDGAFDIGGPDVLTYEQMMRMYAEVAGLPRRIIVPVPVLTPWLSAQWVNLVTPVPKAIAVPLMESLVHDVVCGEHTIAAHIPDPDGGLTGCRRAVELALAKIRDLDVPTRWSDAGPEPSEPLSTDPEWSGGSLYQDVRERRTLADPAALWAVIESIGGEHGWYSFPLAWSLRGWLDRLAGGAGLRRGRRDPHRLHEGEALDWWRVERIERPTLLRLRAEMRVPGRAWLELCVRSADGRPGATYHQRAVFEPHGLAGHLYWKSIVPFHALIFGGMTRNITGAAETTSSVPGGSHRVRRTPLRVLRRRLGRSAR
ncbi:SDR family oxidoreductase [Nocardia sp. NBC_00416]|uniref:SDR family oxidoreductase n=1 Tax=Nocardia sp. NBC_00416 TaxID=2975991 RepID=UPI002E1B4811